MINYFRNIFSAANDQDPSSVRLLKTVLTVATLASLAMAFLQVLIDWNSFGGLGFTAALILSILSGSALFLCYRNIYWPGRLILPLCTLAGIIFLQISADGLHDSTVAAFTLVIIFSSMLIGQKAIPLTTVLVLLGIWTVGYADMTGINKSVLAQRTVLADVMVISVIQVIAAASLNGLMTRLNSALELSRTNEQAQIKSNQELRELQTGLEARVAARTQDLAIVAEVGTATATILETDKLLQAVVDLTKERFNLYHSHIYLLDEAGENLVLASGAGEVGRQMVAEKRSIPLDREQSLVARAARERKGVTVNDVTQAPDFLPNPLLPDTRSELAVPMVVGEKVIGVFDIQSDQVGRFTESDVNIQTTLAAQVATSIQNVRSFEQSKSQADLESLVNAIGQKIQRATTVEDTLQTAIRELGSALGAARVSANIQSSRQHDGDEFSRN